MQSRVIDFRHRAELTERMDEPCSRDQLRACLRDLSLLNRWFLGYRPVLNWLGTFALTNFPQPVRILDVGCGYGDGLRRVERWARRREIPVELTGIDLNPDAAVIASEASGASSRIHWVSSNVFAYAPVQRPHLVVSSLFTHHLSDDGVVRFLRWM